VDARRRTALDVRRRPPLATLRADHPRPLCHVSADLGDGTDIGARSEDGAQRHHVPDDRGITKVPASTLAGVTAASVEKGVRFLEGEIGTKYGWCNMANNVLALLHIPYRTASHAPENKPGEC
jgi:hypothetical protein